MAEQTARSLYGYLDDGRALRMYARRGDPEAFMVLVRRYEGMVLATCRRTLANAADAEDAAQETFLKLAQQAGMVRSNVAAWLHRCAVGTSVDLARRVAAQRRADHRASRAASPDGDAGSADGLVWADLEPVIDRAIAELPETDRQLVVARYLAGRSQAELAREAGVSQATISRRLSRAVGKLRRALAVSGVVALSTAAVVAGLEGGASPAVSTRVGSMLGKIAISGVGSSKPVAGGVGMIAIVSAALLGVSLLAAPLVLGSSGRAAHGHGTGGAAMAGASLGPDRPARTIGPFQVISATDDSFDDRGVWISDDTLSIRHGYSAEGESNLSTLRILSISEMPDNDETKDFEERAVIEARVVQVLPLGVKHARFEVGQRLRIECLEDAFGRLVLRADNGAVQLGRNEPRWYGVRPPIGWPEYGRIPEDAGRFGILGPWTESERIPVTISGREIKFGTEVWNTAIYRVVSWDRVEGWSRVLAVQAGGRDPRLIGTRLRLLLRKDEKGYSIAFYPRGSAFEDRWPSSFEFGPRNPVRVFSFEGGG